jgi:small subunit ribosomal protein S8
MQKNLLFFSFFFMKQDTLSEMITRIRNAMYIKSPGVEINKTRITHSLSEIILREGLIEEVKETFSPSKRGRKTVLSIRLKYLGRIRTPVFTNFQRVSRPGLRIYTGFREIPKILGGTGLVILATSKGLITCREAKNRRLGGEIICSIWSFSL